MFDNLRQAHGDPDASRDFDTRNAAKDLPQFDENFFKDWMEEVFESRKKSVQSDLLDSDTLKGQVRHSIPLDDDKEEIKADDRPDNFSVLRAFPYSPKSEHKLKLEKEVPLPPEYPGAPYKDEMVGDLWLGPEYPAIEAKLQSGDLSREEKINLSNEKARLYVAAEQAGNWRYGPLNERKTTTVKTKLTFEKVDRNSESDPKRGDPKPNLEEPPEYHDSNDEPLSDDDHPDDIPEIDESTLRDVKDVEKNFFKRNYNKAKKYLKGEFNNFSEYTDRKTREAQALAAIGGLAGLSSVIGGSLIAAEALSLAFPPLGVVVAGVAGGLAINAGFAKMVKELWIKKTGNQEIKNYHPETDGELKDFDKKVRLDNKERMKAFAIADIMAKLLGGAVLGHILHPSTEPSVPSNNGEFPGKDDILPSNTADTQPSLPGDNPITETPYATESSAVPTPEIPHQNLVDYVVKASDNSWEQVLHQNGMETMGPDSIKVLSMNRDNIIQMFEKWATTHGGNGTVPIEMGPHSVMQETPVSDVVKMLDEAIRNGYPTEALAKQDYAEYARQLANYQRVTKWVLPGTHLQFPAK